MSKNSKGGRPRVTETKQLKYNIKTTVSEKDYNKIKNLIDKSNLSHAEFIRNWLLKNPIPQVTKDETLTDIKLLLGRCFNEMKSQGPAIQEIRNYLYAQKENDYPEDTKKAIRDFINIYDDVFTCLQDISKKIDGK